MVVRNKHLQNKVVFLKIHSLGKVILILSYFYHEIWSEDNRTKTHAQTTSPKDNSQGHQINEHMWKHFKSATGFISVITIFISSFLCRIGNFEREVAVFLGSSALFPYERIIFVFRIFLIDLSKPLCFLSINKGDKGLMGDCCSPGPLYLSLYSSWFTSIKSDALNIKLTTLSLHVTFM